MTDTRIVHDSAPDDTYRETPYTLHLTANTPAWAWGAFEYPDMAVFAPLGTLGERRDLLAVQVRDHIRKEES